MNAYKPKEVMLVQRLKHYKLNYQLNYKSLQFLFLKPWVQWYNHYRQRTPIPFEVYNSRLASNKKVRMPQHSPESTTGQQVIAQKVPNSSKLFVLALHNISFQFESNYVHPTAELASGRGSQLRKDRRWISVKIWAPKHWKICRLKTFCVFFFLFSAISPQCLANLHVT